MTTWRERVVLLILAVLVAAVPACAPRGGASYGEPGSESPVLEGTKVTLQFQDENQAGGSGGCNTFGAQYAVSDGVISITEIESTLMACTAEGVMEQEEQYYDALQAAGEFDLRDGELRIWYNDGEGVLNFVGIEQA